MSQDLKDILRIKRLEHEMANLLSHHNDEQKRTTKEMSIMRLHIRRAADLIKEMQRFVKRSHNKLNGGDYLLTWCERAKEYLDSL